MILPEHPGMAIDWHFTIRLLIVTVALVYVVGPVLAQWRKS